jgi:hypothetical protein
MPSLERTVRAEEHVAIGVICIECAHVWHIEGDVSFLLRPKKDRRRAPVTRTSATPIRR